MESAERLSLTQWAPPWIKQQHLARYEWVKSLLENKTVLDAACGTGYGTHLLGSVAREVIGVDIAAAALNEANNTKTADNVFLQRADITRLPFADNSFEAYVSFETLEHIANESAYLKEVVRVLHKDGVFVCSTPNREITNPNSNLEDQPFNQHHCREYCEDEFKNRLKEYFSSVELYGQSFYSAKWTKSLDRIATYNQVVAINLHRLLKLISMPLSVAEDYWPLSITKEKTRKTDTTPEYFIAVCRL